MEPMIATVCGGRKNLLQFFRTLSGLFLSLCSKVGSARLNHNCQAAGFSRIKKGFLIWDVLCTL
jgi:hypothetical protein